MHDPESQAALDGVRKLGGQFRTTRNPPPAKLVDAPLTTPADALAVIRATLAQVRSCEVPERVGSAVASLVTVALRAMALRDARLPQGRDLSTATEAELIAELRTEMARGQESMQ